MEIESLLLNFCKSINIEYIGFCPKPSGMEGFCSTIVALFPYYTKIYESRNLSLYACGKDYHVVIREKLLVVAEELKKYIPDVNYGVFVDNHPYNERKLAYKAGIGFIGENGFLINEKYGSYTFIGFLAVDYLLKPSIPLNKTCKNCKRCINRCPTNSVKDGKESCISFISQKKGELSKKEIEILSKSQLIWGCDICQQVCPHNKNVPETPIDEFKNDLILNINLADIENLSNKQFLQKYPNRAFTWRGKKVIERNLAMNARKG